MKSIVSYLANIWEGLDYEKLTASETIICIFIAIFYGASLVIRFITFPVWALPYIIIKSRNRK